MEARVLTTLTALETSLNALVTSLTTTNTFSSAPNFAKDLVSADTDLTTALTTLRQHQDNYARILSLRTEADRLQAQIRSTIRTCRDLRAELLAIDPSVLDEPDEDEKEEVKEVDYTTLLAFAARIGKHNAIAAREAEQDYIRRRTDQKEPVVNGDTGHAETANSTQESQQQLAQIQHQIEQDRISYGIAFPAAEKLRVGALGRLQWLREQEGEGGVERELERIRGEERPDAIVEDAGRQSEDLGTSKRVAPTRAAPDEQRSSASGLAPKPAPAKRKLALSLDFPGSDEDDDDD